MAMSTTGDVSRPASEGEIAARLQANPPTSPADERLSELLRHRGTEVSGMSITQIANEADTSTSTVSRFCRRLGFESFQALRVALAVDAARTTDAGQSTPDTAGGPAEVFDASMRKSVTLLQNSLVTVDRDAFERAVGAIAEARQILCVAMGTSTWAAQQLAHDFNVIGRIANAPMDLMQKQLFARQLAPGDACVVISHPGTGIHGLQTAEIAKAQGAFIVGVTSFQPSPLTEISDAALVAGGHELGLTLEYDMSRIAHVAVLHALHLAVGLRDGRSALDGFERAAEINVRHHL